MTQRSRSSFRDPSGHIYESQGRIFRTVNSVALQDFEFTANSPIVQELQASNRLIRSEEVSLDTIDAPLPVAVKLLEHPKLPFISYPYEWCFSQLKLAALFHLELQMELLAAGIVLSDASAYNVQFIGSKPIFIDRLSLRGYSDGEYWLGHRQFCEQFLNPLLLGAIFQVTHNDWYRGRLEGIDGASLSALMPFWRKFGWKTLTHVVLPQYLQGRSSSHTAARTQRKVRPLPKAGYIAMLRQLRTWISGLKFDAKSTTWGDYAERNTYLSEERQKKLDFVTDFVRRHQPKVVWDLGCNTGDYSQAALSAGAHTAIGFDFDRLALERCFDRARKQGLNLLPLYFDAANPSPSQGWAEAERESFRHRAAADAMLALAFEHHLAIAKNIPLEDFLRWLVSLAPIGVVEFVPKSDQTIQIMLRNRDDIFTDYTEEHFLAALRELAEIEETVNITQEGRLLISYRRKSNG